MNFKITSVFALAIIIFSFGLTGCGNSLELDCPSDVKQCDANVTVSTPTIATGDGTITNDFNNTEDASGIYPLGTTTVTWTLDDGDGNTETCAIEVSIGGNNLIVTDQVINGTNFRQIEGTFDCDYTLTSDINWMFSGGIFVAGGATLTIEAGTKIYAADDASTPYFAVAQGGKIMAAGTASAPIVFTTIRTITGNPFPGDWGGIILNGYANLNIAEPAQGEGGSGPYGGDDDNDSSGTMRYVRVEYAGKILGTDNELNGFSFNGVGRGTTLEYLQAYKGADDGFEFFGGTANLKHAVSTGNEDDSFDWTYGWSGKGQHWVVHQIDSGDRGIEADNNGDDNSATPFSSPVISNLTLVGITDTDAANTGIYLREGTQGIIRNAIVANFPLDGVRVKSDVSMGHVSDGSLSVVSTIVAGNTTKPWKDCNVFQNDPSNSTLASTALLTGYVGTVNENAIDAAAIDSWFDSTDYIGAVKAGDDWTMGWTAE